MGFDTSACANLADTTVNLDTCTGLHALSSLSNVISAHPNPGTGAFYIQSNKALSVVISNMLGEVILKTTMDAGVYSLDLTNYASGLYYLSTNTNGEAKIIKLIKN